MRELTATPAFLHRAFRTRQMDCLERDLPSLVRKISPEAIFLFSGEPEQLPAQFFGQEDGADFSLQRDIGPPGPTGLHHRNSA